MPRTLHLFILLVLVLIISSILPSPTHIMADNVPVSIVAGASNKTNDAYSPDSQNIQVGDSVTWTNDDSSPHTVTSGSSATSDGKFDSSILSPQKTFTYTFNEEGTFPYFCSLHPNMVGTVTVAAKTGQTGQLSVSQTSADPGTQVTVTITDPDLNEDPEFLDDYDPVSLGFDPQSNDFFINFQSSRIEVGAGSPEIRETGPDTGVFTFNIDLVTDQLACANNDLGNSKFRAVGGATPRIGVCAGDLISIKYEDKTTPNGQTTTLYAVVQIKGSIPQSVNVKTDRQAYSSNDFIIAKGRVGLISGVVPDSIGITEIEVEDSGGNRVENIVAGEQAIIRASLLNNLNAVQPFSAIVEVTDPRDVISFVTWQDGVLNPNVSTKIGVSWTPNAYDHYYIKIFVLSSVADLKPLSKIGIYSTFTGNFGVGDPQGQPVVLKMMSPAGAIVRLDEIEVSEDRSFEFRANFSDNDLMKVEGNYLISASYDGKNAEAFFRFVRLDEEKLSVQYPGARNFDIIIMTNSTLDRPKPVQFDRDEGRISISFHGPSGTRGVLYMTVRNYILDDIYKVDLNNENHAFIDLSSDLYTTIKIEYSHSQDQADVYGEGYTSTYTTHGRYEVWYKWETCVERPPSDCRLNRDDIAELTLNFLYPDNPNTDPRVPYYVELDGSRVLTQSNPVDQDVIDINTLRDLSGSDSASMINPKDYEGFVGVEPGSSTDEGAAIKVRVVPEFPTSVPIAAGSALTIVAIALVRLRFETK